MGSISEFERTKPTKTKKQIEKLLKLANEELTRCSSREHCEFASSVLKEMEALKSLFLQGE